VGFSPSSKPKIIFSDRLTPTGMLRILDVMRRRRVMVDLVEVGRLGGLALAAKMSAEERTASARRAVRARWKKYRAAKQARSRAGAAA
jgi:hypothetical protein